MVGVLVVSAAGVLACAGDSMAEADVRGEGRPTTNATPRLQAAAYEAAIRQEFDVDAALLLMADTAMLPRTDGLAGGGRPPTAVLAALAASRIVRGTCLPVRPVASAPTCPASLPGYLVRFSDIFQLPGDTARFYLRFERFQRADAAEPLRPLAFENGYDVVLRRGRWAVVRKARRELTRKGG